MQNKPLISIVTVSFNSVHTIEDTILSIVNQTYKKIEYIIIDGKSTDGTVNIIATYNDYIKYWKSEPDEGIYDAMNKGLNVANGDWILFLGADDILYNEYVLDNVVKHFSNEEHIYYGNVIFKNSGEIYPKRLNTVYKLCLRNFCHQAVFYPKSIYKSHSYNTDYKLWADYVYNMELFSKYRSNFKYIVEIVSIFNNEGRGSINKDYLFMQNRIELIERLYGRRISLIMSLRYKISKFIHAI